jgi:hypothetical protein
MDLINEIQSKQAMLDKSIKELRKTGTAYAQAERDYKVSLRSHALRLRASENMAVTLIDKVVFGIPEVAELRFQRDVAKVVYDANQDAINSIKLQLRLLDAQLSREWGNTH